MGEGREKGEEDEHNENGERGQRCSESRRASEGHSGVFFSLNLFIFIYWPCHVACRISVPWPKITPASPTFWKLRVFTAERSGSPQQASIFFFFLAAPFNLRNFSDLGLNPRPLQWKLGVFTAGHPGKFRTFDEHYYLWMTDRSRGNQRPKQ